MFSYFMMIGYNAFLQSFSFTTMPPEILRTSPIIIYVQLRSSNRNYSPVKLLTLNIRSMNVSGEI